MPVERGQRLERIEVRHQYHRRPDAGDAHAESERRGVIDRSGGEVHALLVDAEQRADAREGRPLLDRTGGLGPDDALRPTRRPRAVEHELPERFILERVGRHGGEGVLVGVVALDGTVDRQQQLATGDQPDELGGHRSHSRRRHEGRASQSLTM